MRSAAKVRKPRDQKKFKTNLPVDQDGKPLPPSRTRKGIPNKITVEAKNAIALAFEGIGGVEGLIKWAKKTATNRAIFYSQIYTKLIPVTVAANIDVTQNDSGQQFAEALERTLLSLIAERRDAERDQETNIIIEHEPEAARDDVPQLVISRPAGTKAA